MVNRRWTYYRSGRKDKTLNVMTEAGDPICKIKETDTNGEMVRTILTAPRLYDMLLKTRSYLLKLQEGKIQHLEALDEITNVLANVADLVPIVAVEWNPVCKYLENLEKQSK